MVDRRDLSTPGSIMQAAQVYLKNFNDHRGMPTSDSSLFAAIQDLLINLPFPGQNIPNQGMNTNVMPQNFQGSPMGPQNPQMGMPQMVPQGMPSQGQPTMMNQQYGNNMGMGPMPGGQNNEGNN